MIDHPSENLESSALKGCDNLCRATRSIETLNSSCFCLSLDDKALRRSLAADLGVRGLSADMVHTHPNLFASVPMFVSTEHLAAMARLVCAVEAVVATPLFQKTALQWAPDTARYDPGTLGGLLGFDFHLSVTGPKVIEINTNPGGALLNTVLGRAHRSCCADAAGLAMAPKDTDAIEEELFGVFLSEWRLQRKDAPLRSIAIVDERPADQYLYPEFLLYRQLFIRHGLEAVICDPSELSWKDGQLRHGNVHIDFVYNRLTDFALEQPAHAQLRLAYLSGAVVVSPHPRAHALYADKRNLTLLCDESFLRKTGADNDSIQILLSAIPRTELMTAGNRDALWESRRRLFFKPAAGYGSKAAYRGDKLTRRVWQEMASTSYVAQELVSPSERVIAGTSMPTALKADFRCYAYAGAVKLVTSRLYQGQTTNFRTPGGGFAPVFTQPASTTQ